MSQAQKRLEPGFFDKSESINVPKNATGAIPKEPTRQPLGIDPSLQSYVTTSVGEVKKMVEGSLTGFQQRMNENMEEVRNNISALAKAIQSITISARQNSDSPGARGPLETPPPMYNGRENIVPTPDPTGHLLHPFNVPPPPMGNILAGNVQSELASVGVESERIRIDKFGLKFEGNPKGLSVEDFIFRLEHLRAVYRIPWSEVIRDFRLLLGGNADQWYWLYLTTNRNHDWPALKFALLSQYQIPVSNFDIMHELVERRQNPGESLDSYFHHLSRLRSRLRHPVSEFDMLKIAKRNLREHIGRIVYPMNVSSLEELRIACNEAERNFPRKDFKTFQTQPARPQPRVNEAVMEREIENDIVEAENDISAINALICWNCKVPGHAFMECPSTERSLFCYKCGRPNVITPKCPKCRPGNCKKSVVQAGEPRSQIEPQN